MKVLKRSTEKTFGGDPMNIKPLFDKVVVEALETEEKTNSGFILPSASQEKQQMMWQKQLNIFHWMKIIN